MAVRVKVLMTINIDESDNWRTDDDTEPEEAEDALREYFHDIDGMSIKNIKTIMENV